MKKLLLCLLCSVLMVGLATGCVSNNVEENIDDNQNSVENNSNTEDNSNLNNTVEKPSKVKTVQVPGMQIYADYDVAMRKKEQPNTTLMYNNNSYLTGLSFEIGTPFNGKLEDVFKLFEKAFINDSATSSSGDLYDSKIVVKTSEKTKIAGRDSIKYTGTVANKKGWDCYVYGYTFIINDIPCAVIGLVSDQAQSEEMINTMVSQVDFIASTIRTER